MVNGHRGMEFTTVQNKEKISNNKMFIPLREHIFEIAQDGCFLEMISKEYTYMYVNICCSLFAVDI